MFYIGFRSQSRLSILLSSVALIGAMVSIDGSARAQTAAFPTAPGASDTPPNPAAAPDFAMPQAQAPNISPGPDAVPAQQPATTVSEVVVTGTSIRGVAPVGQSVQTVTSADIVATGATNVTELLRSVPSIGSFNSTGPNIGGNQANFVDQPAIHGIGVGNGGGGLTLILLDGHRLPGAGINQSTPDPSAIPSSALERVEVIADGASSTYGSDAVAGVINFILKKNYDGAETTGQIGYGNGYSTANVSQLIGKTWDGGSILLDYQHSQNSELQARDRKYITDNQSGYGEGDNRSSICTPGNFSVGGANYALNAAGVAALGTNKCEANQDSDLYPDQHRDQGLISIRQKVAPRLELYGDFLYSHREIISRQGANSGTESNGGLTVSVPSTSPFYIPVPGGAGAAESVNYDPTRDVGDFRNRINTDTANATIGANIDLSHGWHGQIEGNVGMERDDVREFGINQQLALDDAANGTLNPYGVGAANSAALDSEIGDYQTRYAARQTLEQVQAKADGPLIDLPGGALRAAIGVEVRSEGFAAYNSVGPANAGAGLTPAEAAISTTATDGTRNVQSTFVEFNIPIVGAGNSFFGVKKLTLDLSGRYDHYSDVGSATNPHAGINWQPFDGLLLRASASRSFHAPSLADAGTAIDTRAIKFGDYTGSTTPGAYSIILAGGNSGLRPETANNYSAGFDWTPTFIPGLKVSVTGFDIDYKNVITFPTFNPVTEPDNPIYNAYRVYDPTLAQAEALTNGFRHDGVFDLNTLLPTAIYDLRRQNFAEEFIEGLDFDIHYRHPTRTFGTFEAGYSGTYLGEFQQRIYGAQAVQSLLNTDYAINFKSRATLAWDYKNYSVTVFYNYTNGYDNTNFTPYAPVKAFQTIDTHLAWNVPPVNGLYGLLSGVQLSLDANNLFDRDPPHFYNSGDNTADSRGYDASAASALGRVVQLGLRKAW